MSYCHTNHLFSSLRISQIFALGELQSGLGECTRQRSQQFLVCTRRSFAALSAAPVASLGLLWRHREERPELGDAGHWMQGPQWQGCWQCSETCRYVLTALAPAPYRNFEIFQTKTLGAYGPLVLAPAEGLGALQAPCQVGVILFRGLWCPPCCSMECMGGNHASVYCWQYLY